VVRETGAKEERMAVVDTKKRTVPNRHRQA
jgi:hypothetical protein